MNKENNIIVCGYDDNGNSVCEFRDLRAVKAFVNGGAFRWPEIYTMTADELKESQILEDIARNTCSIINTVCSVSSFSIFIVDAKKDNVKVSFDVSYDENGNITIEES